MGKQRFLVAEFPSDLFGLLVNFELCFGTRIKCLFKAAIENDLEHPPSALATALEVECPENDTSQCCLQYVPCLEKETLQANSAGMLKLCTDGRNSYW